jgi:hypothetical protein
MCTRQCSEAALELSFQQKVWACVWMVNTTITVTVIVVTI